MIIVCPECSTKFNVDSDRIPDAGAKVRCARCKHVFLAVKPLVQESPFPERVETFQAESVDDKSFSETTAEVSDFSYDKFQELDSSSPAEETFTFGAEAETEIESILADNREVAITSSGTSGEDFTFTESAEEPVSTIEKVFTAADEQKNSVVEAVEAPAATEEEVSSAFTAAEESPAEPEFPSQPVPEKKGGAISSIIRILLLLILGILIIGGVFVYMNGTDQLNQTIQQIFGQQIDQPVQTGQITLGELEGKFIQNEQAGELFLIRGEAINNFTESRAAIQVKGVIFDQNGKPLLQKTVFCGNSIDDDKLLTLSFSELEEIMGNQFGNELSNMKIGSEQSIPFDIIFKELPKNLSEFSVKVTSSKPATE
ncbi:MAG: zinc-ribbon domain-containing protein [Desulfuromusa sp.]|nr:zinc-ribbon domain-containing protein [Desulfuromusa sp.]